MQQKKCNVCIAVLYKKWELSVSIARRVWPGHTIVEYVNCGMTTLPKVFITVLHAIYVGSAEVST